MAYGENFIMEHNFSSTSKVRKKFEALQELYVFFTGWIKLVIT